MIVETHNGLGQLTKIECTRLVVLDRFDQPQIVAIEPEPGQIFTVRRGEAGFQRSLKALGIKDTVIDTQVLDPNHIPPPPGKLLLPPDSVSSN